MKKNIVISLMAAYIITDCMPWVESTTTGMKILAAVAYFLACLFFCTFLDEKARERRRKKRSAKQMEERLREISEVSKVC